MQKPVILLTCCLLVGTLTLSADCHSSQDVSMDLAVKLKPEYADDIVSDLFALSYDLIKIAKVVEIDKDGLFHFRIKNPQFLEEDMHPTQIGHRTKRHVDSQIDRLRGDNRVEYVISQEYLERGKRILSNSDIEALMRELELDSASFENQDIQGLVAELEKFKAKEHAKRKSMLHHFEDGSDDELESEVRLNDLPSEIDFNDRDYGKQWYLINEGQMNNPVGFDLNVKKAWLNGYTGKNISIVIVDDGLDHEHPDFAGKYRKDLSYDLNDENDMEHDPMPRTFDDNNNHGTKCAGAAAAKADNFECGVGVAYNADIGGIRILDGRITDMLEARSLLYKVNETDIKTMSWGPTDNGQKMEYPKKFVNHALEESVKNGRNGKGTILVWASGNGGTENDDCSCDGYVSNWNVISIGSINHRGLTTFYSELCPSTMAVVYSGGRSAQGLNNEDDPGVRVSTTNVRGQCDSSFQGTSAAAPIAAGVFALVLEANPNLGYRDLMHIIARTSKVPNLEDQEGWVINAANYHVNEKYGFGVLDAAQMVQEAQGWENVPPRQICTVDSKHVLPSFQSGDIKETDIIVSDECPQIDFLEHVVANISFSYPIRGQLKMTLISPFGTPSEILSYRKHDDSSEGIQFFPYMTVYNWGESPIGKWRLIVEPMGGGKKLKGSIDSFSLNFFGFKRPDEARSQRSSQDARAYVPSEEHLKRIYDEELKHSQESRIVHKRVLELNPEFRAVLRQENNQK